MTVREADSQLRSLCTVANRHFSPRHDATAFASAISLMDRETLEERFMSAMVLLSDFIEGPATRGSSTHSSTVTTHSNVSLLSGHTSTTGSVSRIPTHAAAGEARQHSRRLQKLEPPGALSSFQGFSSSARNETGSRHMHGESMTSMYSNGSMFLTRSLLGIAPVKESRELRASVDLIGNRIINEYCIIAEIGRGSYGVVMLAVHDDNPCELYAMKILKRSSIIRAHVDKLSRLRREDESATTDEARQRTAAALQRGDNEISAVRREIAIMKKLRHRSIVTLHAVIDDPASDELFLIMDYIPKGAVLKPCGTRQKNAVELHNSRGSPEVTLNSRGLSSDMVSTGTFTSRGSGRELGDRSEEASGIRMMVSVPEAPLKPVHWTTVAATTVTEPLVYDPIPIRRVQRYVRQLLSALNYLHQNSIFHRDIKPDNILLGENDRVYISDFGVSEMTTRNENNSSSDLHNNNNGDRGSGRSVPGPRPLETPTQEGVRGWQGTMAFWPPEMFSETSSVVSGVSQDLWALGVTTFAMIVGRLPFPGKNYFELRSQICSAEPVDLSEVWSSNARDFLSCLLAKDPAQRKTTAELRNHEFTRLRSSAAPFISSTATTASSTATNGAPHTTTPLSVSADGAALTGSTSPGENSGLTVFVSVEETDAALMEGFCVTPKRTRAGAASGARSRVRRYVDILRRRVRDRRFAELQSSLHACGVVEMVESMVMSAQPPLGGDSVVSGFPMAPTSRSGYSPAGSGLLNPHQRHHLHQNGSAIVRATPSPGLVRASHHAAAAASEDDSTQAPSFLASGRSWHTSDSFFSSSTTQALSTTNAPPSMHSRGATDNDAPFLPVVVSPSACSATSTPPMSTAIVPTSPSVPRGLQGHRARRLTLPMNAFGSLRVDGGDSEGDTSTTRPESQRGASEQSVPTTTPSTVFNPPPPLLSRPFSVRSLTSSSLGASGASANVVTGKRGSYVLLRGEGRRATDATPNPRRR